jgi:hypothetical protein
MPNTSNHVATTGHVHVASVSNRSLPAGGMHLGPLHFEESVEQLSVDGAGYVWAPHAHGLQM